MIETDGGGTTALAEDNLESVVKEISEWQQKNKFERPIDVKSIQRQYKRMRHQYKQLLLKSLRENTDKWMNYVLRNSSLDTRLKCKYGNVEFVIGRFQNLYGDIPYYYAEVYVNERQIFEFDNLKPFAPLSLSIRKVRNLYFRLQEAKDITEVNSICEENLPDCSNSIEEEKPYK